MGNSTEQSIMEARLFDSVIKLLNCQNVSICNVEPSKPMLCFDTQQEAQQQLDHGFKSATQIDTNGTQIDWTRYQVDDLFNPGQTRNVDVGWNRLNIFEEAVENTEYHEYLKVSYAVDDQTKSIYVTYPESQTLTMQQIFHKIIEKEANNEV